MLPSQPANPKRAPATPLWGSVAKSLDDPKVATAVRHWLFCERLTYAATRARVREKFGVIVSQASLCRFRHECCLERRNKAVPTDASRVTFEGTLQADTPVTIRVINGRPRFYLTRVDSRYRVRKISRASLGRARPTTLQARRPHV